MTRQYANNFSTTLASPIASAGSTSCVITSATGLSTLTGSDYYVMTIDNGVNREIVRVTARSGTTLTITRGQEGSVAQAWSSGVVIEIRETAASFTDKLDAAGGIGTGAIDFGGATSFEVPNSSAPSLATVGQIALDTSVTDHANGLLCFYSGTAASGIISIPLVDLTSPTNNYVVTYDSSTDKFKLAAGGGGGGSGDVVGPASATDGSVAIFDTGTGKLLKSGTDATIQTVRFGLGANAVSTNTVAGANSALGSGSLSGTNNTAVGYGAGAAVTSGTTNTFVGSGSGSATTSGSGRVCIGYQAGAGGTTGNSNSVAIGYQAGSAAGNTSSYVYIGYQAGQTNGNANCVAIGYAALSHASAVTSGSVVMGHSAGQRVTGNDCVYIGRASGGGTGTSASGASNVAVGTSAGAAITTATLVCAYGDNTFASVTTGNNNTGFGYKVGVSGATGATTLTTGSNNTFIGYRACGTAADNIGTIAIGHDAVALKATGATSADHGPGIAIGSTTASVGFRGDGTIYPSSSGGAGFMRQKLNGTQYFVPLFADGSTAIGTGGGGVSWTEVTSTTQSCAVNSAYIANNAGLVSLTLPATAAVGDTVEVVGKGAGLWRLTANTGQTVKMGSSTTTSAGSLTGTSQYDSIAVVCITANTTWAVRGPVTAGFTIA